jgi:hypothetical protein
MRVLTTEWLIISSSLQQASRPVKSRARDSKPAWIINSLDKISCNHLHQSIFRRLFLPRAVDKGIGREKVEGARVDPFSLLVPARL